MKVNLTYFGLWLIIPFSSLSIHKGFFIPPNLLFFLVGTVVLLCAVPKPKAISALGLPVFVIGYFFISQVLVGAPFTHFMGVLFAVAYFVIVLLFARVITFNQVDRLSALYIKLAVLLLVVEWAWRMTHPNLDYLQFADAGDIRWIYLYKYSSFMYSDSNATAIHIVVVLFYIFYLEYEQGERWTKSKFALIILLLFTFSRAAWFGAILGWVYIRFLQRKNLAFYLMNFTVLMILFTLGYQFYLREKIETDLSFQTKFDIVNVVLNYFTNANWREWLFGIGFSNSPERLGIYAHNFAMVFLIESGIVGLFLIILLMTHFVLITKRKALFILVPFVITTLSATVTFMPFFYVAMALIYLMQKKEPGV